MITRCFYHSQDLDGHCSGAIVKYRFPEAVMHPVTSKKQQLYDIDEEDGVHEFTSCAEVWRLLFPDKPVPLAVELIALYESGDYQGHELEDMVLPFQMRMRMEELDPKDWGDYEEEGTPAYWWEQRLLRSDNIGGYWLQPLIVEGRMLLRYDEAQKAKYAGTYAFETILEVPALCSAPDFTSGLIQCGGYKYRAIAINIGHTNSKVFDSVWRRECRNCQNGNGPISLMIRQDCPVCNGTGYIEPYDLMITFVRRSDKLWNVSLYSTKPDVDCGAIAESFGGGGHKGAAGFQCKELPFKI